MRRANRETAADALHVSYSTLRQRLDADGTSFAKLLDVKRVRRCEEEMDHNREIRGKQLAGVCGYTELNSFYRSFERLHGMGFLEYKQVNYV